VDSIERLLAVKTRLTTIKGYAQLLEREIDRSPPRHDRLGARVQDLNSEIARLIALVASMETSMTADPQSTSDSALADDDDYISSAL
jgi:hypothetical protein